MSHYVVKVYGLVCDVCERDEETVPAIDEPNKLAAARRQLSRPPGNWRYVNGKDICGKSDGRHIAARAAE